MTTAEYEVNKNCIKLRTIFIPPCFPVSIWSCYTRPNYLLCNDKL